MSAEFEPFSSDDFHLLIMNAPRMPAMFTILAKFWFVATVSDFRRQGSGQNF
ncbi:MAG: hypothetical protein ABSH48_25980 [Verrucomicrobiota bacterium]